MTPTFIQLCLYAYYHLAQLGKDSLYPDPSDKNCIFDDDGARYCLPKHMLRDLEKCNSPAAQAARILDVDLSSYYTSTSTSASWPPATAEALRQTTSTPKKIVTIPTTARSRTSPTTSSTTAAPTTPRTCDCSSKISSAVLNTQNACEIKLANAQSKCDGELEFKELQTRSIVNVFWKEAVDNCRYERDLWSGQFMDCSKNLRSVGWNCMRRCNNSLAVPLRTKEETDAAASKLQSPLTPPSLPPTVTLSPDTTTQQQSAAQEKQKERGLGDDLAPQSDYDDQADELYYFSSTMNITGVYDIISAEVRGWHLCLLLLPWALLFVTSCLSCYLLGCCLRLRREMQLQGDVLYVAVQKVARASHTTPEHSLRRCSVEAPVMARTFVAMNTDRTWILMRQFLYMPLVNAMYPATSEERNMMRSNDLSGNLYSRLRYRYRLIDQSLARGKQEYEDEQGVPNVLVAARTPAEASLAAAAAAAGYTAPDSSGSSSRSLPEMPPTPTFSRRSMSRGSVSRSSVRSGSRRVTFDAEAGNPRYGPAPDSCFSRPSSPPAAEEAASSHYETVRSSPDSSDEDENYDGFRMRDLAKPPIYPWH